MVAKISIRSAKKVFMYAGMQESEILFTWPVAMERSGNLYGRINKVIKDYLIYPLHLPSFYNQNRSNDS